MVAYPIDQAKTLLEEKLVSQQNSMTTCQEDLEFLREQITTMEVNIGIDINTIANKKHERTIGTLNNDGNSLNQQQWKTPPMTKNNLIRCIIKSILYPSHDKSKCY